MPEDSNRTYALVRGRLFEEDPRRTEVCIILFFEWDNLYLKFLYVYKLKLNIVYIVFCRHILVNFYVQESYMDVEVVPLEV